MSRSRFTYSSRRTLGKGAFSTVFLGTETGADGTVRRRVAVKRIDKAVMQNNAKLRRLLRNEMRFLAQFDHPHIVALLGSFESPRHMHLVLEYCDGGDLAQLLRKRAPIPEPWIHDLLSQLVQAVQHMRSKQVAHRDLKPQNMLLVSNADRRSGYDLKLADFGFATRLGTTDLTQTFCGSPLHMAPELISGESYNPAVDLWSIGTIAYEMCAGIAPFRAKNVQELRLRLTQVRAGSRDPPPVPATVSPELRNLIKRLLMADPSERLTFDGFFAHPFFHKQFPGTEAPAAEGGGFAPSPPPSPSPPPPAVERSRLETSYILVDRAAATFGAEIDRLEQLPEPTGVSGREPALRAMLDGADGAVAVLLALARIRDHIEAAALLRHAMQILRTTVTVTRGRLTAIGQRPTASTFAALHRLRGTLTACLEGADRLRRHRPGPAAQQDPPGELSLADVVLDAALQLMDRAAECSRTGLPAAATALCRAAERALEALRVRSDDPLPSLEHENLATAVRQQLVRLRSSRTHASVFDHRLVDSCVLGAAAASKAVEPAPPHDPAEPPRSAPIDIPGARATPLGASVTVPRFCAHCGARFTAVENFCPLCGTARLAMVSSVQDSDLHE